MDSTIKMTKNCTGFSFFGFAGSFFQVDDKFICQVIRPVEMMPPGIVGLKIPRQLKAWHVFSSVKIKGFFTHIPGWLKAIKQVE